MSDRKTGVKKKVIVEIEFDEWVEEYEGEDPWAYYEPSAVRLHPDTDMDEGQLDSLGETVAQTDFWQVDMWNNIASVIGGSGDVEVSSRH